MVVHHLRTEVIPKAVTRFQRRDDAGATTDIASRAIGGFARERTLSPVRLAARCAA